VKTRTDYIVFDKDLDGYPVQNDIKAEEKAKELDQAVIVRRKQKWDESSKSWVDMRVNFPRKDFEHAFFTKNGIVSEGAVIV